MLQLDDILSLERLTKLLIQAMNTICLEFWQTDKLMYKNVGENVPK